MWQKFLFVFTDLVMDISVIATGQRGERIGLFVRFEKRNNGIIQELPGEASNAGPTFGVTLFSPTT